MFKEASVMSPINIVALGRHIDLPLSVGATLRGRPGRECMASALHGSGDWRSCLGE